GGGSMKSSLSSLVRSLFQYTSRQPHWPGGTGPSKRAVRVPEVLILVLGALTGRASAQPAQPSFVLSMAQLASGGGWDTTLTLVNASGSGGGALLNFYDNNGSAMQLPLTFPQSNEPSLVGVLPAPGSPFLVSEFYPPVNGSSVLVIDTQQPGSPGAQVGSAQLLTTGTVVGFAIFKYTPSGQEAV